MRYLAILLVCGLALSGQERRFQAIELFVDSGDTPLAAWQIELTVADASIVGVEGGATAPWLDAPRYDPEALTGGRIILAAFTLTENAPAGRLRIARLHIEATDSASERVVIAAVVAAGPGGERIPLEVECLPYGEK